MSLKDEVREAIHTRGRRGASSTELHRQVCDVRIQAAKGAFPGHPHLSQLAMLWTHVTLPSEDDVHRMAHKLRQKDKKIRRVPRRSHGISAIPL